MFIQADVLVPIRTQIVPVFINVLLTTSLGCNGFLERLLVERLQDGGPDKDGARRNYCYDHVDVHQEAIHHQRYVAPVVYYLPENR